MEEIKTGKRWSGADWGKEQREIMIVGLGGIGSWLALSLARIDHELFLIDGDRIDDTNVTGGQLYRSSDIGEFKVNAISNICREFGCTSTITTMEENYVEEIGMSTICICGLDNMKARREVFEAWEKHVASHTTELLSGVEIPNMNNCLFIDGRLTLEMFEIFCIQGNNEQQIAEYRKEHLFDDSEANSIDCTTKQSTFAAMGIASFMTATLCNWLTNRKMDMDFREVPFSQRVYFPIFQYRKQEVDVVELI